MEEKEINELRNGLVTFATSLIGNSQLNQTQTAQNSIRGEFITNNRALLSSLYIEHGLLQKAIDLPVDDGFRGGFEIRSKQIDDDDVSAIMDYIDEYDIIRKITNTIKWGRLFGGSGLVIKTSQPPELEFNINRINKFTPIDFYAADLWELNMQYYTSNPSIDLTEDAPYMFYGIRMHKSRVLKYVGKPADSFAIRRFRGWGMSELEKIIRAYNQYTKFQEVLFDILDQLKLDIFRFQNFNASLLGGANQQAAMEEKVQLSNMIKNYLNALVMDKDDEYEQKQISLTGLSDIQNEINKNLAAVIDIPLTRIFGVSAAGFNSGEDDIENYNAMIEGQIRSKVKPIIKKVITIISKKVLDIIPDNLEIGFKPLRIMSTEQEEIVKTSKSNRVISLFTTGMITVEEAKNAINKDNLLSVDIDIDDELSIGAETLGIGASDGENTGSGIDTTAQEIKPANSKFTDPDKTIRHEEYFMTPKYKGSKKKPMGTDRDNL